MIKEELKIALIQTKLVWENREKNIKNISKLITDRPDNTDVVILPEMFTSGFTMHPKRVAENMDGPTLQWAKGQASKNNIAIVGSLVIEENGNFYNRLIFVDPSGDVYHYNKRHLFTLAGEQKVYTAGNERLIVNFKGWRICPLVCYDLRFPVWSRNNNAYDILIYVANWPEPRIEAWDALLKARAIENMSYCIGVNRVGDDENNNTYTGHSAVYNMLGVQSVFGKKEGVLSVVVSKSDLKKKRERFQFLEDRDTFSLKE